MKSILAIAILLVIASTAEAQPDLGGYVNNPMLTRTLTAMFVCEEVVVRSNFFLPGDEKRIWPLIRNSCTTKIDGAEYACGLVTDYDEDDCETIIGNLLNRNYEDVARDIIKENR
jgi:hypothetical protein